MRIAGISLSWLMKSASKTPARSRTTKVGPIVDQICDHAYQFGLPDAELLRLVELVTTGTELDQSNITTLIKSFYPTGKVSSTIVTRIVNCLGQAKRKPPSAAQAALVKWLTAIHDVLEDQISLLRFYGVLFNLLDMISLRWDVTPSRTSGLLMWPDLFYASFYVTSRDANM